MIVSAHQPHYLPWVGYINKIYLSDVFLLMDNMTFTNKGYISKNRIMSSRGVQFLTVPVIKPYGLSTKINELIIDTRTRANWNLKHLRSLKHNYAKGVGFDEFYPIIESVLEKKHDLYFDLQYDLIKIILNYLNINTKVQLASEKSTQGAKETELIVNILKDTNCNQMLLGLGASNNYVDFDYVNKAGFKICQQEFSHPRYKQNRDVFVSGISIVDLIFCNSKQEASNLVKNCGSVKQI
jgi:hypothetical protein